MLGEVTADESEGGFFCMQAIVEQAVVIVLAQAVERQNGGRTTLQATGNAGEAPSCKEVDHKPVSFS